MNLFVIFAVFCVNIFPTWSGGQESVCPPELGTQWNLFISQIDVAQSLIQMRLVEISQPEMFCSFAFTWPSTCPNPIFFNEIKSICDFLFSSTTEAQTTTFTNLPTESTTFVLPATELSPTHEPQVTVSTTTDPLRVLYDTLSEQLILAQKTTNYLNDKLREYWDPPLTECYKKYLTNAQAAQQAISITQISLTSFSTFADAQHAVNDVSRRLIPFNYLDDWIWDCYFSATSALPEDDSTTVYT